MNGTIDQIRRASRIAFGALALTSAVACSDDPVELEDEPEVVNIIISSGTSSATVSHVSGTQTGTLTLVRGQANTVTFRFVGANGQDEAVIAGDRSEYELRASPLPTSLAFSATGGSGASFTATITPSVAGTVSIPFQLWNVEHGHPEVSRTVTATVQ